MTAPTADFITALRARGFTLHGVDWLACAHRDEQFAAWLCLVDYELHDRVGFGLHDIPDRDWRGMYDDDLDPAQAAIDACIDLIHEHQRHEENQP
jgi:hypothetical protein